MAELLPGDEIAPSLEAIMSRPIVGVDTYAAKKALMGRRRSAPASLPLLHGVRVAQVDQGEGEGLAEMFGFIRYNLSPQTGNPPYPISWLEITTTGRGPSGQAFLFDQQGGGTKFDGGGGDFWVLTEGGTAEIDAGTGTIELNADSFIHATTGDADLFFRSDLWSLRIPDGDFDLNATNIDLLADGGSATLRSVPVSLTMNADGSVDMLFGAAGKAWRFLDSTFAPLFVINEDGTISAAVHRIQDVVDPVNPQDAATKAYVDAGVVSAGKSHILLADSRATPFAFTDQLQMDDGSDFMWSD